MDFIITSEHRVGSRWMHYLFAQLLGKDVSPEMDVTRLVKDNDEIRLRLRRNKIVKFHRAVPITIFESFPGNYKLLGVVRNPRDRGVSFSFHNRYHENNPDNFEESKFSSDDAALRYTILKNDNYREANKRQRKYMMDGYSTRDYYNEGGLPYIWTSYEWLKEDTAREVRSICDFLGVNISEARLKNVVKTHSFKNKAGRKPGQEDREDTWRRKGVNNDWENWFDEDMIQATETDQNVYWEILNRNNGNSRESR